MTSCHKEKKQIHSGCEFSLQLAQGHITTGERTFHSSTSTDIWGFIVARKVQVYVEHA